MLAGCMGLKMKRNTVHLTLLRGRLMVDLWIWASWSREVRHLRPLKTGSCAATMALFVRQNQDKAAQSNLHSQIEMAQCVLPGMFHQIAPEPHHYVRKERECQMKMVMFALSFQSSLEPTSIQQP